MKSDTAFYQQQQPQLQTLHYLAGRFWSGWGKKKKKKKESHRWGGLVKKMKKHVIMPREAFFMSALITIYHSGSALFVKSVSVHQ